MSDYVMPDIVCLFVYNFKSDNLMISSTKLYVPLNLGYYLNYIHLKTLSLYMHNI